VPSAVAFGCAYAFTHRLPSYYFGTAARTGIFLHGNWRGITPPSDDGISFGAIASDLAGGRSGVSEDGGAVVGEDEGGGELRGGV
jgi:hypothetical protein